MTPNPERYVRFQINIPQEIILKSPEGKDVSGQYGPQVLFHLSDGRLLYADPAVARKIEELNAQPGDRLIICKPEAKAGNSRAIEWYVHRLDRKPQAAAEVLNAAESLDAPHEDGKPPITRLEYALKTALVAARAAEEYSKTIGKPVQFDKDDIRLMAQTLVINESKRVA